MKAIGTKLGRLGAFWLALLLVFAIGAHAVQAQASSQEAANKALDWVRTQQQVDGSFAGFGAGSTIDAVLAIVAAGQDPAASYANGGKTPMGFLESKVADLTKTTGGAGKLLLAVAATGGNTASFGGVNLIDAVNATYGANTGHFGSDAIGHAFAMLGLRAAGQPVPAKAAALLNSLQGPEGGWSFDGGTKTGSADTNSTAVAVQALIAAGEGDPTAIDPTVMKKALAYLTSQQNTDGGFPYQQGGEFGSESDVNSTSYVVQALLAMGANASKGTAYLLSMQKPNGAFQWKKSEPDDNAGATYQAVPAILGATLVRPKPTTVTSTPGMPTTGESEQKLWIAGVIALAALTMGAGFVFRHRLVA